MLIECEECGACFTALLLEAMDGCCIACGHRIEGEEDA